MENLTFSDVQDLIDSLEESLEVLTVEQEQQLADLRKFQEQCSEYSSDWACDWIQAIHEDNWVEYVREMLEDGGDIPKDLPSYIAIDWQDTADNIAVDYTQIELDGTTYYVR